jgi:hypothetical protein
MKPCRISFENGTGRRVFRGLGSFEFIDRGGCLRYCPPSFPTGAFVLEMMFSFGVLANIAPEESRDVV